MLRAGMVRVGLAMTAGLVLTAAGCGEEAPPPGANDPITPPADARMIEREISPTMILMGLVGGEGDAGAFYEGMWVAKPGWRGEVKGMKKMGNVTRFTIGIESTTLPAIAFIQCDAPMDQAPNDQRTIREGGFAEVTGRIAGFELGDGINTPMKILLDRVTIESSY